MVILCRSQQNIESPNNMALSCKGNDAWMRVMNLSSPLSTKVPQLFYLADTGPKTVFIPLGRSTVSTLMPCSFFHPEYTVSWASIYCTQHGAPLWFPSGPKSGTQTQSIKLSIKPKMLYGNSVRSGINVTLPGWSWYIGSFWQYSSIAFLNLPNWAKKHNNPTWPTIYQGIKIANDIHTSTERNLLQRTCQSHDQWSCLFYTLLAKKEKALWDFLSRLYMHCTNILLARLPKVRC